MKTIVLDKIASVTKSVGLKREVRLSREIPCEEGIVIAVRILTDKSVYNQLELPPGTPSSCSISVACWGSAIR